ncbi:hypothetical protein SMICM17S_11400 [Streptomyces microflavus]
MLPSQLPEQGAEPLLYAAADPGAVPGGYYGPGGRFGLVGPTAPARITRRLRPRRQRPALGHRRTADGGLPARRGVLITGPACPHQDGRSRSSHDGTSGTSASHARGGSGGTTGRRRTGGGGCTGSGSGRAGGSGSGAALS